DDCAEIEERIGFDRLVELTGNRALTGFTAPKLLWLRRHEPETYAAIRHVLLPKDYVRLRMTGERAIDVADASGTLLFDVRARRWRDRKSTRLNSSHVEISYAVFCLKKKRKAGARNPSAYRAHWCSRTLTL